MGDIKLPVSIWASLFHQDLFWEVFLKHEAMLQEGIFAQGSPLTLTGKFKSHSCIQNHHSTLSNYAKGNHILNIPTSNKKFLFVFNIFCIFSPMLNLAGSGWERLLSCLSKLKGLLSQYQANSCLSYCVTLFCLNIFCVLQQSFWKHLMLHRSSFICCVASCLVTFGDSRVEHLKHFIYLVVLGFVCNMHFINLIKYLVLSRVFPLLFWFFNLKKKSYTVHLSGVWSLRRKYSMFTMFHISSSGHIYGCRLPRLPYFPSSTIGWF